MLSLHTLPGNQSVLAVASVEGYSMVYICRQPHLGVVVGEAVAEQFKVFRCYCSALVEAAGR